MIAWQERVRSEALTWLGTPYHHQGRVKGVGVDCGQILIAIYEKTGILPIGECEPGYYPADWALHNSEEKYLAWVQKYCDPVSEAQVGDIVLFQFGRCISHAGIVIEWPIILHSFIQLGVILSSIHETILCDKRGRSRMRALYRPRIKG